MPTPPASDLASRGAPGVAAMIPASFESNVRTLSSDAFEGRAPGTRGGALAEDFVAAQFAQLGLSPAGESGTFFQTVPLRDAQLVPESSGLTIRTGERTWTFKTGEDACIRPFAYAADVAVEAPLVFAGFGIARPDLGYDDLAELDVRGAMVVLYRTSPGVLGGKPVPALTRVALDDLGDRRTRLRARGARAVIVIYDADAEERMGPFETARDGASRPVAAWMQRDERYGDPVLPSAMIRESTFDEILSTTPGAPRSKELRARLAGGERVRVALDAAATLRVTSTVREYTGRNVAGLIHGSDHALASEVVVFSAHHDHLGVGKPVAGDAVYNGAIDNASGVAGILEVARAFRALPTPPRRSVLFLATTAEEKGLLGAGYFVRHPTPAGTRIVADINIDTLLPAGPLERAGAVGLEASSLIDDARAAARAASFTFVEPRPELAEMLTSGDCYAFAINGIPSAMGGAGSKAVRPVYEAWMKTHYHQPSDEWRPEYQPALAVQNLRFNFFFGLAVASDDAAPRWNADSPFGR